MKRTFTASITQEGDWFVAQCLEVDVASQGKTADDAVANLREAIALHTLDWRHFGVVARKGIITILPT